MQSNIKSIKSISIWIFVIPFLAVNSCLYIITTHPYTDPHPFLGRGIALGPTFPYIDGGASISRVVRNYPMSLIFKPAMFITGFLLIRYWINSKKIAEFCKANTKDINKIIFFGVGSAVMLVIHSIFLGIKFEYDLYKLFRRIVMISFIVFELIAQFYFVKIFFEIKNKLNNNLNSSFLKIKKMLIQSLIFVSIVIAPFLPFDNFKFLKHALEWNVFLGVITFYFLSYLMWKKN